MKLLPTVNVTVGLTVAIGDNGARAAGLAVWPWRSRWRFRERRGKGYVGHIARVPKWKCHGLRLQNGSGSFDPQRTVTVNSETAGINKRVGLTALVSIAAHEKLAGLVSGHGQC